MIYRTMAAVLLSSVALPGVTAEEAKRIGCFRQVTVPAEYRTTKKKIKDSYRVYVKRANGRIDLMEYPPVYEETKHLVKEAYTLMKEVDCND
ncbi:hypothetical protein [Shimia sp.]|uniref:hypothetical protein n=1 Tax=Shimia sp. TaxID=1954381 RepID=UPI00356A69C0